jgi:hypothetical protein
MSSAHMHKGASQQLTEKHRGVRWGRTRPKRAWADRGRPVPSPVRAPFDLGAHLFTASASGGRHIHPIIRELPTRRKSTGRKPMAAASPRVA